MLDFTAEVDNHLLQFDSYKLELDRFSVYRLAPDKFIYIRSLEAGRSVCCLYTTPWWLTGIYQHLGILAN